MKTISNIVILRQLLKSSTHSLKFLMTTLQFQNHINQCSAGGGKAELRIFGAKSRMYPRSSYFQVRIFSTLVLIKFVIDLKIEFNIGLRKKNVKSY